MHLSCHCNTPSFLGTTKVYALSDSHQETGKTRAFLSKILKDSSTDDNVLLLNGGDLFKGIDPKDLERDSYIKMKEEKPDIEMVTTIGNNDFGFNAESLNYLINTIKLFSEKGIKTVCANIFQSDGTRPEWLQPYTIVERDGDRTFITGFCIDNINTAKFGIVPKKQAEVLNEIQEAIIAEKPDNVIVLNHDYMPTSQSIVKTCRENGINVDLVIGGHDHDIVPPDKELHIYYPQAFYDSMYRMDLINTNGQKELKNVEEIKVDGLEASGVFKKDLEEYERTSGINDKVAPYVLNLTKQYSDPCPLGSFLADEMKDVSGADIGFFSTGFLMKPMEYKEGAYITNYLFKKTIIAENLIKTVELNSEQLKELFQHALKSRGYGSSNPKFLQCSNNVVLEGKNNQERGMWELKQIYIDGEALLDENSNPIHTSKKYKCVMDSYIADGGQGFNLQTLDKKDVVVDGKPIKINEVLMNSLKQAAQKYPKGSDYPSFTIREIK